MIFKNLQKPSHRKVHNFEVSQRTSNNLTKPPRRFNNPQEPSRTLKNLQETGKVRVTDKLTESVSTGPDSREALAPKNVLMSFNLKEN